MAVITRTIVEGKGWQEYQAIPLTIGQQYTLEITLLDSAAHPYTGYELEWADWLDTLINKLRSTGAIYYGIEVEAVPFHNKTFGLLFRHEVPPSGRTPLRNIFEVLSQQGARDWVKGWALKGEVEWWVEKNTNWVPLVAIGVGLALVLHGGKTWRKRRY